MTSSIPDYRATYFPYPDLTKIHGPPTARKLLTLHKELKANARSVFSILSDGQHGHLGLVLNPVEYALISAVPFIVPPHPGILNIPPAATASQAASTRDAHREALRIFLEGTTVKSQLVQQIVKAIDPVYLATLQDRITATINAPIWDILTHLWRSYGRITPQLLQEEEADIITTGYDARTPIDTLFNKLEDFNDLANIGGQPVSETQLVSKAYIIVLKTRKFNEATKEWNRLPPAQKTWTIFKTHFRQAHQELLELSGGTIADDFNSANLIQQIVDGVNSRLVESPQTDPDLPPELIGQANNLSDYGTKMLQMMQMMQDMNTRLQSMETPRTNRPSSNTGKYCWSHGGCNHYGRECNSKKTGHKDEATFSNLMGGSTRNVRPRA